MEPYPPKLANINVYIKTFPADVAAKLTQLREVIKELAPTAEEAMSYGIPTFKLHGNLVHFAGYEHHIGFYPGSGAIRTFHDELKNYKTSKGAVQFPLDQPLPLPLIRKIVKSRVSENIAKAKK